jgi:hypothetical protein
MIPLPQDIQAVLPFVARLVAVHYFKLHKTPLIEPTPFCSKACKYISYFLIFQSGTLFADS